MEGHMAGIQSQTLTLSNGLTVTVGKLRFAGASRLIEAALARPDIVRRMIEAARSGAQTVEAIAAGLELLAQLPEFMRVFVFHSTALSGAISTGADIDALNLEDALTLTRAALDMNPLPEIVETCRRFFSGVQTAHGEGLRRLMEMLGPGNASLISSPAPTDGQRTT